MRWERNEQKQKVMKKGWKNVSKEKHKKSREIHLKNTEEFFLERYKAIKLIKQVFVRKNASLEWKRIKMRKGRSSRKEKTLFLSDFFGGKNCEGEYFNTRIFFYNVWQKMANRNLFCFWKINKNENPKKRGFNNRVFLYNKNKMLFSHFSKEFSTLWKIDIGKMT